MPTFTHGKNARVYGNGYDLSGFFSTVTVSGEAETAEVTTLGNDDKVYIPGLRDATISLEGYYAGAEGEVDDLLTDWLGDVTTWTVVMSPDSAGALAYCVRAVDTSYEVGAEIGGAVAVSAEGQVTEGREAARVLVPKTTATETGTGSAVDNASSSPDGLAAYLHVMEGSGSLVVKVQHSADNSTWVDLATFTTVTADNAYQRVAVAGNVNRYLRATYTISGEDPSFTFHVAAARF
jgi:hypothetical protein